MKVNGLIQFNSFIVSQGLELTLSDFVVLSVIYDNPSRLDQLHDKLKGVDVDDSLRRLKKRIGQYSKGTGMVRTKGALYITTDQGAAFMEQVTG